MVSKNIPVSVVGSISSYIFFASQPAFSRPLNFPTSWPHARVGPWVYSPLLAAAPPTAVLFNNLSRFSTFKPVSTRSTSSLTSFQGSVSESAPSLEDWGESAPLDAGCERKTLQDIAVANFHLNVSSLCDIFRLLQLISSRNKWSGVSSPPTAF